MLTRILEPEVMDTRQEAVDYDAIDHREVNRRFVDDLLAGVGPAIGAGEWLDLGTGTALIPLELAARQPTVRVVAVDLAQHMLDLAAENIARRNLSHAIRLDRIDAKRLPYRDGQFAGVMSNSIVHHIPEPLAVLREAVRVTAPGGFIYFRDLLRPDDETALEQLVALHTAGANAHQRQMFADSLRAALTLAEVQDLLSALDLPRDAVRVTSDRHWTILARRSERPLSRD